MYKLVFTKQALKDWQKILASPLKSKVTALFDTLQRSPLTPPYEKLCGDLEGLYSKRINLQHRLVYEIVDETTVKIVRMWTHYGDN